MTELYIHDIKYLQNGKLIVSILYPCVQMSSSKQKYSQDINNIHDNVITLTGPLTIIEKYKSTRKALITASAWIRILSSFLRNVFKEGELRQPCCTCNDDFYPRRMYLPVFRSVWRLVITRPVLINAFPMKDSMGVFLAR